MTLGAFRRHPRREHSESNTARKGATLGNSFSKQNCAATRVPCPPGRTKSATSFGRSGRKQYERGLSIAGSSRTCAFLDSAVDYANGRELVVGRLQNRHRKTPFSNLSLLLGELHVVGLHDLENVRIIQNEISQILFPKLAPLL